MTRDEFIEETVMRLAAAILQATPQAILAPDKGTPLIVKYAEELAKELYGGAE